MSHLRLVGLVALLAGCTEPPPERLDPSVVSDLTTERGDAEGLEASGGYRVLLEAVDCGCSDLETALQPLTMCGALFFAGLGQMPVEVDLDVVESDGRLVLSVFGHPNTKAVGPLNVAGDFEAGAVSRLTSFATSGSLVTRFDGDLSSTGEGAFEIEGTIENRLLGQAELEGIANITQTEFDCRETVTFAGPRYIVR